MNEYYTPEILGTFVGMVAAVTLLTQFFKPLIDKITKIPTRFVVWFISILVVAGYTAAWGVFTLETIYLLVINTILITLASMGTYEVTLKKLEN